MTTSSQTYVSALTLLFLPAGSLWLRYLASQCTDRRFGDWVRSARRFSVATIFAVPIWWCLNIVSRRSAPSSVLLLLPLFASALIARVITYRSDQIVCAKKWRFYDLVRLAFWRTVSSTLALLLVAVGIERAYSKSFVSLAWMFVAGIVAVVGRLQLRAAEGVVPRPVKSGELYKRSQVMSKKMSVHLKRVCVIPFGRGRLTNAYGGVNQIAVTDDYGHWLHGSQLDFVIAHELAHVKHRDALKTLVVIAGVFSATVAGAFLVPQMTVPWRITFNFVVIILPLLLYYAQSRRHEYSADRAAVEATNEPEIGIQALISLYRHTDHPPEYSRFQELFSSHPTLWRRIDAIARTGRISPESLASVKRDFARLAANCES